MAGQEGILGNADVEAIIKANEPRIVRSVILGEIEVSKDNYVDLESLVDRPRQPDNPDILGS